MYYPLVFFFLIGAVLPLTGYLISRKFPNSFIKYVNFPVIFSGYRLHPTRDRRQLRALGDRRLHLPIRHPAAPLLVVDEIQLSAERGAGLGGRDLRDRDLLLLGVSEERDDWRQLNPEVVGEHGVPQYGRLELGVVEDGSAREDVWRV